MVPMKCFVTGANRGLGLELCRQLLPTGARVWATYRGAGPGRGLADLINLFPDKLSTIKLDLSQPVEIQLAARELGGQTDHLDLLINNAGVFPRGERPGTISNKTLAETFQVNTFGPLLLTQEVLPLIRKSSRGVIINMTSQLGSLERKRSGGSYSYSASKAALNMISRALAADLRPDGIIVIALHPGWVVTDMGGSGAPLSAAESISGILALLNRLSPEDSGKFYTWNGQVHPW